MVHSSPHHAARRLPCPEAAVRSPAARLDNCARGRLHYVDALLQRSAAPPLWFLVAFYTALRGCAPPFRWDPVYFSLSLVPPVFFFGCLCFVVIVVVLRYLLLSSFV